MNHFVWDVTPTLAAFGAIQLRYYGILFALGIGLAIWSAPSTFARFGIPRADVERYALALPLGMLIGAHYIHLIFYEPSGLSDFRLGLDPASGAPVIGRFWNLGSGLASHGGALGCVVAAAYVWARWDRPLGVSFHRVLDALMPVAAWVFPFVRLGNFFNSEILGRPSELPWAVVFASAGPTPRHPVQLYEAAAYFAEVALAQWLARTQANRRREGVIFYTLIGVHFSLRFVLEFFKDSQHVDEGWMLNMGHWLSVPPILLAAWALFASRRFHATRPLSEAEVTNLARFQPAAAKPEPDGPR